MSPHKRVVDEYTALLSRAFNGAIEVNGTRIVAHPSGTLLVRTPNVPRTELTPPPAHMLDRENDWSDVAASLR